MSSIKNPGNRTNCDDTEITADVGGHAASFAQLRNGHEVQNDRMSIMETPDIGTPQIPDVLKHAILQAGREYRTFAEQKMDNDAMRAGSTTISMAAYDPTHYTLDVASIDDSPVFVILEDDGKAEAVMVSTPAGHMLADFGEFNLRLGLAISLDYKPPLSQNKKKHTIQMKSLGLRKARRMKAISTPSSKQMASGRGVTGLAIARACAEPSTSTG